jgi:hypothetical protein
MKCPHCLTEIHFLPQSEPLPNDVDGKWSLSVEHCPKCDRNILHLLNWKSGDLVCNKTLIHPRVAPRLIPPEVPNEFAEDFREAALVIADSPKASAALSRRCLQHLLLEKAGIKPGNLASQIDEVLKSKTLPSHIAEEIDAIRNIGNFAAHASQSHATGEIVPVERGEAEWTLNILEGLFDFYFVQPAKSKQRRDDLNVKLGNIGKPPMK